MTESLGLAKPKMFTFWLFTGSLSTSALEHLSFPLLIIFLSLALFVLGKSHGQRGLAGHSPWGHKRVRHDLATKPPSPDVLLKMLSTKDTEKSLEAI